MEGCKSGFRVANCVTCMRLEGRKKAPAPRSDSASLVWLIARYRESSAWATLSMATRRQRKNIFQAGYRARRRPALRGRDEKAIIDARERRKETPARANNLVTALRGLFKLTLESEMITVDPACDAGMIETLGDGFHAWSEEEIARFEARWPTGTRERLAFDLLLYTGLRRGDAVRLANRVATACFVLRPKRRASRSSRQRCRPWPPVSRQAALATSLSSRATAAGR